METESTVADRHDRESPVTEGVKPPGDERSISSFTGKEAPVGTATQRMEQSQVSIAICDHDPKQTLEALETFDPLTGLHSRHAILGRVRDQVNLANRYRENFSLILLDIDHFRKVNDRYGHGTGDDVLEKVAALIRANIRDTDMPGHYGGDEFTVILPRTDLSSSWVAAERLRSIIGKTELRDSGGNMFAVTVSQGLVGWERNDDVSSLISRADEALRKAQQKGGDCVQILLGPSLRDKV
jgi:diguanylate cyclase (GGDEF)-like protein